MSATSIIVEVLGADSSIIVPVWPTVAPQTGDVPCITLHLVSERQDIVLNGARSGFDSLITVACLDDSAAGADDLAELVKAALGYTVNRTMTDGSTATIVKDGADFADYSDDRTIYRRIVDFHVRWVK